VKGRSVKTTKQCNLNEIILKIVRQMQPISSDEIWWEMGESLKPDSMPSQIEVNQRLEQMEKRKILKRISSNNGREKYTLVE